MSETCHHCGKPPEGDGDHSCPCPYPDDKCPYHRLRLGTWDTPDEMVQEPPPWPSASS